MSYSVWQKFFRQTHYFVLIVIVIALALRLILAITTYGTEDVASWNAVGEAIARGENPYRVTHFLRWPPLWMIIILAVKSLSVSLPATFTTLIKLPPILADVAIAVVIYYYFAYRRHNLTRARRLALLYAFNPVSILIVAGHGQFDSIPTLFLLLSAYFAVAEASDIDLVIAAIFFGLAVFAKGWALFLLPLFIARLPGFKLKAIGLALALFPYVLSVGTLYALTPKDVLYKVLVYASLPGWWGLTSFASVIPGSLSTAMSDLYNRAGSVVLLLAECVLGVYYARRSVVKPIDFTTATLAGLLVFYVLTPGYGTQYLLWVVPFVIIAADTDRWGYVYLALISVELLIEYLFLPYACGLGEWILQPHGLRSECFHTWYGAAQDIAFTNILRWPIWIASGVYLLAILKRWRRSALAETPPLLARE
jgi:Gpi18-like mannosyltransferase